MSWALLSEAAGLPVMERRGELLTEAFSTAELVSLRQITPRDGDLGSR